MLKKLSAIYHRKWLLHLLFIIPLLTLLGFLYWDEREENIEENHVENLLPHAPHNLNISAIEKINQSIRGSDHFSFVILGDSRGNDKKFKQILQEALQHKPDFIIHTGDFTGSGKYKQYIKIAEITNQCPVPMVFIVGNHDISNCGVQCFSHIFGPLNFYFDIGSYRFICINDATEELTSGVSNISEKEQIANSYYNYEQGLDDNQIEGIGKLLKEGKQNFIVMHIPPTPADFPLRYPTSLRNSERFLELTRRFAPYIKIVFCGHYHGYGEFERDGVTYIVTAGAGAKLYPPVTGIKGKFASKFNYVLVDVKREIVEHTVYYLE